MSPSSRRPEAPPQTRRTFSAEFKAEAVHLMRRRRGEGVALSQIGRELGVRPALLWEWARKLDGGGTGPMAEPTPGRLPGETVEEEVRRLRRENAILRQEREFAKKAAAFFARESR
jgi:transposase